MAQLPTAVSDAWNAGLRRVFVFRLAGAGLLKAPERNSDGIRSKMPWQMILAVASLVAFWTVGIPLLLSWGLVAAQLISPMSEPQANGLLVSICTSFLVLTAGTIAFAAAGRHIDRADEFLNDDLRVTIAGWIHKLFSRHWIGWAITFAIACALWLWVPEVRNFAPDNPGAWVSFIEMGLIVGTVGFFAGMFPRVTPQITYARTSDLNVFRLDPAATPAVRLIVEMISIGGLLLLAVLIAQTVVWYFVQQLVSPTLPVTIAFGLGFLIVVAGIVNATLVPTVQLHSWIVRQKLDLLRNLNDQLTALDAKPRPTGRNAEKQIAQDTIERAGAVEEFFHITAVENGPFRSAAMVQFGAAVVGSAVAYAFVLIFGDPSK
jgi:hypothetical protein